MCPDGLHGDGEIFSRGDGDGGSIPDGEFPIAILDLTLKSTNEARFLCFQP